MCIAPEEHERLIWHVVNHYGFGRWEPRCRADMRSEGFLALVRAARTFDPAKGKWSTYACRAIRNALVRLAARELRYRFTPLQFEEGDEKTCYERCIPPSVNWECVECGKGIDWEARKGNNRQYDSRRNLCFSCERAKSRAKTRGWGEGVCAKCARVIRARQVTRLTERHVSRPSCDCYPIWPCYTPEDVKRK